MERYFSSSKASTSRGSGSDKSKKQRYQPYKKKDPPVSNAEITRRLLDTLSDEANPITHSDIGKRTDHVVSLSTGHQVSDGTRPAASRREYFEDRSKKLVEQRTSSESDLLQNVRVYINGYLAGTTDIEMKRIVTAAGGEILSTPSQATHIITSMPLSASKTQKLLTKKSRILVHVVTPEWITDSVKKNKRQPERLYNIINTGTKNLLSMWKQ